MMQYLRMEDPEDFIGANRIKESLEQRWAVADQEVFIAAVILNPFYQGKPFAPLACLNIAGVHNLLTSLWARFHQSPVRS